MKWRYTTHPITTRAGDFTGKGFMGRIITPEQEAALGGVWFDTPTELQKEPKEVEAVAEIENDERAAVMRFLDAKEIKYDKRLGIEKLKALANG